MTNKEILNIAMAQSAIDSNCSAKDFMSHKNVVVISKANLNARKYLDLPFICDLTSYGNNIVVSVSEHISEIAKNYVNNYAIEHCFETPNLHVLMENLKPFNINVCFMAEYFLPDVSNISLINCKYETRLLEPAEFQELYLPEWENALCHTRKSLDRIAIGAYVGARLIGLAGASEDCESMWQIGIDVLPEYRNQGIASSLTSQLALNILDRGVVPFYCCAWSNIRSVRNAIKSGFRPAWVQLTVKKNEFILSINNM